eukprot:scaffold7197_cov79-Skeletonema_dohrnii-CCMP3373.AAC.4
MNLRCTDIQITHFATINKIHDSWHGRIHPDQERFAEDTVGLLDTLHVDQVQHELSYVYRPIDITIHPTIITHQQQPPPPTISIHQQHQLHPTATSHSSTNNSIIIIIV